MRSSGRIGLGAVVACLVALGGPVAARADSFLWSAPIGADRTGGGTVLESIACPSASQCTASDEFGQETTFNPSSPGTPDPITLAPGGSLQALVCPSTTQCVGVSGSQEVTFDPTAPGNATPVTVDSGHPLVGVACPAANQCTAVDTSGGEVTFNPSAPGNPSPSTVDSGNVLFSVACPSTSQCTAVDNAGKEVTFNPGSPFTTSTLTVDSGAFLEGLSCPSGSQCTVVTNMKEFTFNPSTGTLTSQNTIDTQTLGSSTCFSTTLCVAVEDAGGREVTYNPQSAGAPPPPTTIDPGTTLNGVACASVNQCTAIDFGGREVTFNPSSPGTPTLQSVDPINSFAGVACPSGSQCTGVDSSGRAVTFDPTSPGTLTPVSIDGAGPPHAIACGSTSQCTVVDGTGHEVTFNPDAPGTPAPVLVDSGQNLVAVACPSASQCTGVDTSGNEVTFNPNAPGTPTPHMIENATLFGVSCPTTTQCTAEDGTHQLTFNPASPGTPTPVQIDGSALVETLACPTTTQCTAVDNNGGQVTFNPSSHATSSPTPLDVGGSLFQIACPSASQCTTADTTGHEVTFNPAAPGSPTPRAIAGANLSEGIACPSIGECVTVDDVGNAFAGFSFPLSTAAPTISGTAQQGQTLTEQHGAWTNSPTGYAYQWEDCDANGAGCAPISGATSQTYAVGAADVGHTVRVEEIAINANGSSAPATSGATAVVAPAVPVNTAAPGVSGIARAGQTLAEHHGVWTNSPTSYSYRWEDCDAGGAGCAPILGATGPTYKLAVSDVGYRVRVQETASNAGGAGVASSSTPTTVVALAPPKGAVASVSGASFSGGGTATETLDGITVTVTGEGAFTLSVYAKDPARKPTFAASGRYFDLETAPRSRFTAVRISDCNLNGGKPLERWSGRAWSPVSPQVSSGRSCETAVLGPRTSPTIGQLVGTVFAVADSGRVGLGHTTAHGGRVTLSVRCQGKRGALCLVVVTLTARSKRGSTVTIGSRTLAVAAPHGEQVSIGFAGAAVRLLNAQHRLKARITVFELGRVVVSRSVTL